MLLSQRWSALPPTCIVMVFNSLCLWSAIEKGIPHFCVSIHHMNDRASEVVTRPLKRPRLFHGLQLEGSQESEEVDLDTWFPKDGKELWLIGILDED